MSNLNKISKKTNGLYEKGLSEGIDFEDYKEARQIANDVIKVDVWKPEEIFLKHDAMSKLNSIIEQVKACELDKRYNSKCYDYVLKNASLLPLALYELATSKIGEANIDIVGNNSVTMPCVIPRKSNAIFVVKDIDNRFQSSDGISVLEGNNIEFMSYTHGNLNTNEIIETLCHLYGFNVPFKTDKSVALADNIKTLLAGDLRQLYIQLLEDLRDTLKDKGINYWKSKNVDELYAGRMEEFERVLAGEPDPNFTYVEPPKKIVLLPQEK